MPSEQSAIREAPVIATPARAHPDEAPQVFTRSTSPAPGPVDEAPRIVVARTFDELREHRLALGDLAAHSLECNVFYESILAEPAVRSFGAGRRLELVFVYRADPGAPQRPPRLFGFFPFERTARYRGLPIPALVSFKHLHCFLGTPLVRREGASQTIGTVFDWLGGESGSTLVELRSIASEGPVHQLLVAELHARRRPFWLGDWSTRALFEPADDAERYLHGAVSGLALKEVRRKERRLRERGRLVFKELEAGEDAGPWLREFLRLEASGWKGRERSALACNEPERNFFVSAATAAHGLGRLMLLGLFLDDRPLALKCNFLTGDGGFAFKIAFDETYRAFSPGFLLEVENVRRLHRRAGLRWMDSCADAEHAMINRLWPARRTMATVLFATGRAPGDLLVSLMPLLRWGRRKLSRRAPPGSGAAITGGESTS
jgi:GNAT acetyltransferase-like protein